MAKEWNKKERKLIDYIIDATEELKKEEFAKADEKVSEKATKLVAILEDTKGISMADKKKLAEAFSVIVDEDIPFATDEKMSLPALTAVVLTGNFDNHGYELNKVIVHTSQGMAISPEGTVGSMLQPPKKHVRPATKEEIENLPEKQVKGIFKETDILIVA
jgi:hypothetical protein